MAFFLEQVLEDLPHFSCAVAHEVTNFIYYFITSEYIRFIARGSHVTI
jgi:hypothetical protein